MSLQRYDGSAWKDYATLFAEIISTGATDGGVSMSYVVTLRHSAIAAAILPANELQPTHRLAWGAKTLNIFDVAGTEQGSREIRLQCKELLPES